MPGRWLPESRSRAISCILLIIGILFVFHGSNSAEARRPNLNGLIVFGSDRGDTPYEEGELFAVNPDDSGLRDLALTDPPGVSFDAEWSPDGQVLAYWIAGNDQQPGIYLYRPSDGSRRYLTDIGLSPSWSPDFREIVAVSHPIGGSSLQLYVFNLETGLTRRVTDIDESSAESPSWSPDGKKILFTRFDGVSDHALYTVRPDGSELTRLAANFVSGEWSPDGKQIVARTCCSGASDIVLLDEVGRLINNLTVGLLENSHFPTWSPDGRLIAFANFDAEANGIYVITRAGANLHQITSGAIDFSPDWQPIPKQCGGGNSPGKSCPWVKSD